MSEQAAETAEVKIRIDGTEYLFPMYETLSYGEAILLQETSGLLVGPCFSAILQGDAKAKIAFALVAKRRDDPLFDVADLHDLPLDQIVIVDEAEPEQEDMKTPLAVEPVDGDGLNNGDASSNETEPSLT